MFIHVDVHVDLGASAGAPLVSHIDVDKVAFTGSVATGSAIMKVWFWCGLVVVVVVVVVAVSMLKEFDLIAGLCEQR
jgi:hypothetical protein